MHRVEFQNISDERLLFLIKDDNELAFDELFWRYWQKLFKTAAAILRDDEKARDITQEIFTQCWAKRKTLNVSQPSHYLYQATKLKCFEHLRRDKIAKEVLSHFDHFLVTNNLEEEIRFREAQRRFEESLASMPEKCQLVFKLSRIDHLSNQEIAKKLNISLKTVEYHMTNALKHLKLTMVDCFALVLLIFF